MPYPLLEDYKSKKACPECKEHKLITNDFEKAEDSFIYYHCLGCNNQFSEYGAQKKSGRQKAKSGKGSLREPSLSNGVSILFLILATILLINVITRNEERRDDPQRVSFYPVQLESNR
ncbi:hypothetical protein [cf. Phormidesmis sp. LEGE 11477]|uniref:hypothetical protein n=1 Tax=cf. Phormidesmis sp. LEGE 11477 TaxID=1828680 RepID=UPI00187E377C|nr:hypothetical protein [cf. Phormidesmis sp. LEGE 11477]MBE9063827.1 hypothetical protein [cf. Phormidesmis sp. LEGE 11477]